jgi:hypothetical protein
VSFIFDIFTKNTTMPQPLSFIKLRDAEYVDQFAGSVVPELKDAQKVLNERYDLAEENDSKRAAIAREMMQNVADKDKGQAQLAYKRAMDDIEANKAKGDYENMYGKTANSARQFSVNAAKFIGEKKRIDSYLDQLNKREDISNANKAVLREMALSKQNALAFDPDNNLVLGDGFKEDAFSKDLNVDAWANKMSEGFIPDQTSWNGGKFIRKKTGDGGDRLMFVDNKGTEKFVTPTDVENYVADIAKVDPDMQGYIDRLTKERLHQAGEDWRNPDPNNYNLIRKDVESEVLAPTKRAMGNKFGFSQVVTDRNYQQDAIDAYKQKAGLKQPYASNQRPEMPSTTVQTYKKVDLENLTQDHVNKTYGKTSDFRGATASPSISTEVVKGKTISELAKESENGIPVYRGLQKMIDLFPKNNGRVEESGVPGIPRVIKGETEEAYTKRINTAYNSFLTTVGTRQSTQDEIGTESKAYTDVIFGPEIGTGDKTERTSGGLFSNSLVWVEDGSKLTKFQNGREALNGTITKKDLASFSVTGFNNNYADFGGAFEAVGKIGGKDVKMFIARGLEDRKYHEPLTLAENVIASGETQSFNTQILIPGGVELPVNIKVEPLREGHFKINKEGKFENVEPVITITYPDGTSEEKKYSSFKKFLKENSPYQDYIKNKNTNNQGEEEFKVRDTDEN